MSYRPSFLISHTRLKNCSFSFIKKHHQPIVIHEGRILRKWHLPIMANLQQSGALVGLIDNGTYLHHTTSFQRKLDWIDISIDGTMEIHNKQRNNGQAYQTVIKGLKSGREVAHKVTSLLTLTSPNYNNVYDAITSVIHDVDEFHITPVSPVRQEIAWTETSMQEFCIAWKQLQRLQQEYPEKVFVRMYRQEDLVKLNSKKTQNKNQIRLNQGRQRLWTKLKLHIKTWTFNI